MGQDADIPRDEALMVPATRVNAATVEDFAISGMHVSVEKTTGQ